MVHARNKPTTNEFYRSVLESALREQWEEPAPETKQRKAARSRRLSSLYGYNATSNIVKQRLSSSRALSRAQAQEDGEPVRGRASRISSSFGRLEEEEDGEGGDGEEREFSGRFKPAMQDVKRLSKGIELVPGPGVDEETEESSIAETKEKKKKKRRRPRRRMRRSAEDQRASNLANSMILQPEGKMQPWYCGYANSAIIPPSSVDAAARRYGHVGALNMQRLHIGLTSRSIDFKVTNLATSKSMPNFRSLEDIVDEYKPPLIGQPGAWPAAATYVTGSTLKKKEPVPKLTPHIEEYALKVKEQLEDFKTSLIHERRSDAAHHTAFMKKRVPIQVDPHTGRPLHEKNKLVSEEPRVRYWRGVTALRIQDEDEETLAATRAREVEHRHAIVALKWSESSHLFKLLRSLSVQLRPGLEEFRSLQTELQNATKSISCTKPEAKDDLGAVKDAGATPLDGGPFMSREIFVNVLCTHFVDADRKRINKLYSGFDPHRLDQVDYRIVLATQRCFWKLSQETSLDKILAIFDVMEAHNNLGVLSADEIIAMLQICALSEAEEMDIITAAGQALGETAGSHSLLSPPGFVHRDEFAFSIQSAAGKQLVDEFSMQLQKRLEIYVQSALAANQKSAAIADEEMEPTQARPAQTEMLQVPLNEASVSTMPGLL